MRSERDGKAEVGRGDLENGESELEEVTIVEELVEEWSNKLGPKYEVKVRCTYKCTIKCYIHACTCTCIYSLYVLHVHVLYV